MSLTNETPIEFVLTGSKLFCCGLLIGSLLPIYISIPVVAVFLLVDAKMRSIFTGARGMMMGMAKTAAMKFVPGMGSTDAVSTQADFTSLFAHSGP
jgi:hypothetical protein